MIDGLTAELLTPQCNARGRRLRLWPDVAPAAETGFSLNIAYPGTVTAWLSPQTPCRLVCLQGMIQLAVFDSRRRSASFTALEEFFIGEHHLLDLTLPAGVHWGWKVLSAGEAWLLSDAAPLLETPPDLPADTDLIPYQW